MSSINSWWVFSRLFGFSLVFRCRVFFLLVAAPLVSAAGVHEIEEEQRDKIVFLTAGIAVLSLLVNGTTTGPLVRFLKLDRYA